MLIQNITRNSNGAITVFFSNGTSQVLGSSTSNLVIGNDQNNNLIGGKGDDVLWGKGGNDILDGGQGNDFMDGGTGNDILAGGAGNDTLDGGAGSDILDAGAGNDTLIYTKVENTGTAFDQYSGGLGTDTLVIDLANTPLPTGFGSFALYKQALITWFNSHLGNVDFRQMGAGSLQLVVTSTENIVIKTPPDVKNDAFTLNETGTLTGNVLSNDSSTGGEPLSVFGGTQVVSLNFGNDLSNHPVILSANLLADGTLLFNPNHALDFLQVGQSRSATFTYKAFNVEGASSPATVTVTVNGVNTDPVAINHNFSTNIDDTIQISSSSLLTGDTDVEHDTLSVSGVSNVTHGTVSFNAQTQQITFIPTTGFIGQASFQYTISDGHGGTSTATAFVTVNDVQDATITVTGPAVVMDENSNVYSFGQGNGGPQILITDADGTTVTEVVTVSVNSGSLSLAPSQNITFTNGVTTGNSITMTGPLDTIILELNGMQYTPNQGFDGTDTLSISAKDPGSHLAATQQITITVNEVQDTTITAPASVTSPDGSSIIFNQTANQLLISNTDGVVEKVTLSVSHGILNVGTIDTGLTVTGDGSAQITLEGKNAALFDALNNLKYTPNTGFSGSDSLAITSQDDNNTDPNFVLHQSVGITVNPITAVNDSYTFATPFNTAGASYAIGLDPNPFFPIILPVLPPDTNGDGVSDITASTIFNGFLGLGPQASSPIDVTENDQNFTSNVQISSISSPVTINNVVVGTVTQAVQSTGNPGDPYLLFTPTDPNFSGPVDFTYTIQNAGLSSTASVHLDIYARPVATNDTFNFTNTSATSFDLPVFNNDTFQSHAESNGGIELPNPSVAALSEVTDSLGNVIGDVVLQSIPFTINGKELVLRLDTAHASFEGTATFQYLPIGLGGALGNIATVTVNIDRGLVALQPNVNVGTLSYPNITGTIDLTSSLSHDGGQTLSINTISDLLAPAGTIAISADNQYVIFHQGTSGIAGTITFQPAAPGFGIPPPPPNPNYLQLLLNSTTTDHTLTDSATIQVTDTLGNTVPLTLSWIVAPNNQFLFGTSGDDNGLNPLNGAAISAQTGAVYINGFAGDDQIFGGPGNDVIYGGDGNDSIFAGSGNDVVNGGNGDDFISVDGNATVDGGAGNDTLKIDSAFNYAAITQASISDGALGIGGGGGNLTIGNSFGVVHATNIEQVAFIAAPSYTYHPIDVWNLNQPTNVTIPDGGGGTIIFTYVYGVGFLQSGQSYLAGDQNTHLAVGTTGNDLIGLWNDNGLHITPTGILSLGNSNFTIDPGGGNDVIVASNNLNETIFLNMQNYNGQNNTIYIQNFDLAHDSILAGIGTGDHPLYFAPTTQVPLTQEGPIVAQQALNEAYSNLNDHIYLTNPIFSQDAQGNAEITYQILGDTTGTTVQGTVNVILQGITEAQAQASLLTSFASPLNTVNAENNTSDVQAAISSSLSKLTSYAVGSGATDFQKVVSYDANTTDHWSLHAQSVLMAFFDISGHS